MEELRYTLLSDGPADKALMSILTWLLRQHVPNLPIQSRWADLRRLLRPPRELHERIRESLRLYPCDLLFVHRDAETTSLVVRLNEIKESVLNASVENGTSIVVCVVPVRMTEAWLLFDIDAIRQAAGNPNGTVPLNLPTLSNIEAPPNPKRILHDILREATELSSRRKKRFDTNRAVLRIPDFIEDFSPLRRLSAFFALEEEVKETIESQGWNA
jgi:hypothetical protein